MILNQFIRLLSFIFIFFSISAHAANSPAATTSSSFSPAQQAQIQNIVRDYLLNHPEILVQVAQKLQQAQAEKAQNEAHQTIGKNASVIFSSPGTPVAGNPKGNVTLVYFFDYQCSHCKTMDPIINKAIQEEPQLRVVFKELPVFGATSEYASRAALAAEQQGKYLAFHSALMKEDTLTQDKILSIAKSVGLNIEELKSALDSEAVTNQLKSNLKLAGDLSLPGTPALIIAPTPGNNAAINTKKTFLIPGSTTLNTIKQLIIQVRK